MAEAGGLTLPPKNDELKKQEEAALHGSDLTLKLLLPDGSTEIMQVKNSTEVGYVKLVLSQKKGVAVHQICLSFGGKPMIDPMSLCDHPGVEPPEVEVKVEFAA